MSKTKPNLIYVKYFNNPQDNQDVIVKLPRIVDYLHRWRIGAE